MILTKRLLATKSMQFTLPICSHVQALFIPQKMEILLALTKLGENLSETEKKFMEDNSDSAAKHFSAAKSGVSQEALSKTIRGSVNS
jgi:hypothetical protein